MGIYLNGAGLTPTIQSVHIADHANTENAYRYALLQSTINMQPSYADLTFSGNTRNEVTIGRFNEPLTQDVALAGADFGFACGYTLCLNTVPAGRTLTVAPGTRLAFDPPFGIAIAGGGTLQAEGTISRPITFTSSSTATHWIGLWAQAGSTLRLDHLRHQLWLRRQLRQRRAGDRQRRRPGAELQDPPQPGDWPLSARPQQRRRARGPEQCRSDRQRRDRRPLRGPLRRSAVRRLRGRRHQPQRLVGRDRLHMEQHHLPNVEQPGHRG